MDACKIGRNYFCQDGCSRKHIETNIDGAILDRCSQNHIGSNMDGIILAKMDSYKPYLLAPFMAAAVQAAVIKLKARLRKQSKSSV